MTFNNPQAGYLFLLLILLCLLYGYAVIRRKRSLAQFADPDLLPALLDPLDTSNRGRILILFLAALAAGIFALMRPQLGSDWEEGRGRVLNILVAIDTSKSMLTEDLKPNRLEKAIQATRDLAGSLRGDRIGLIAFSGEAFLVCPLTGDINGFLQSLKGLEPGILPLGGTSISSSIEAAVKGFGKAQGEKILMLLTDGEDHEGDPVTMALSARKEGIRIFTVGFGTGEGGLIPIPDGETRKGFLKDNRGNTVKSSLQEEVLIRIAGSSNGSYVRFGGQGSEWKKVYSEVLSRFEKGTPGGDLKQRAREWFQVPLIMMLLLMGIGLLIREGRPEPQGPGALLSLFLPLVFFLGCGNTPVEEAHRYFREGKYDEALKIYEMILPKQPESALLNYNMGVLWYRKENLSTAMDHLNKALLTDDPVLESHATYSLGNCKVRLADAVLETDPEKARELYLDARDYFMRTLELTERDEDSRINLGIVEKRINALDALPSPPPKTREEGKKGAPAPGDQERSPARNEVSSEKAAGIKEKKTELTREEAEDLLKKHQEGETFWTPSAAKRRKGPPPAVRKDW